MSMSSRGDSGLVSQLEQVPETLRSLPGNDGWQRPDRSLQLLSEAELEFNTGRPHLSEAFLRYHRLILFHCGFVEVR